MSFRRQNLPSAARLFLFPSLCSAPHQNFPLGASTISHWRPATLARQKRMLFSRSPLLCLLRLGNYCTRAPRLHLDRSRPTGRHRTQGGAIPAYLTWPNRRSSRQELGSRLLMRSQPQWRSTLLFSVGPRGVDIGQSKGGIKTRNVMYIK